MKKQTILLADDNERSLKLLKAIYEGEGYLVLTASDGLQAIEQMTKGGVDLIVTDVLMPNMDGYYLCYKIRSHPKFRDIPIIIYTATYTSVSEEGIAKEMGADAFIRKPAALQMLVNTAKNILANPPKRDYALHPPQKSVEVMHQYSSQLINKLEMRNLELEETKESMELILSRFKKAQMATHLGYWEREVKTGKVIWSDEIYKIFGLEIGSCEPSIDGFLKRVHPEDLENVQSTIQKSFKSLEPYSIYFRIIQPGGITLSVFSQGDFEFNPLHEPVRLYGTILDISELAEKERNLKQANKEQERLIYSISHDLRGPIASSLGLLNLAKSGMNQDEIPSVLDTVEQLMYKQDKILVNLVKIMSLKSQPVVIESISLTDLIGEVLSSVKKAEKGEKINIQIQNAISTPIESDRESLYSILFYLLENAIHFRRKDISEHEVNLHVSKTTNQEIKFEISDNGTGISEAVQSKIYDMFYRGSQASSGTGLGLYIVKCAVDRMGGTIELDNLKKQGAFFTVKIPLNGN
jgi:signal transduction histidine kinase/CheY-like chemotaxis protein